MHHMHHMHHMAPVCSSAVQFLLEGCGGYGGQLVFHPFRGFLALISPGAQICGRKYIEKIEEGKVDDDCVAQHLAQKSCSSFLNS